MGVVRPGLRWRGPGRLVRSGCSVVPRAGLAERVDLASTARTIQDAISAGLDQAHLIHQVTSEPGLTGSARAVNAMAIASGNPWGGHGASDHTSVDPRDLLSNRLVSLPDPIREAITATAEQTTQTMSRP